MSNISFPLIDSHCHLDFPEFDADREAVVQAAYQNGVEAICIPATEASHWQPLIDLSETSSSPVTLFVALGIHPWFIPRNPATDLASLNQTVGMYHNQVVAIGETGLDFAIKEPARNLQQTVFEQQLSIALKHQLPAIIHARKSHDQILKTLRQKQLPRGGIIHAFSGSEQQAYQYIDLGFKLGFGGGITYDRARKTRQLAASLPLQAIVLETDAPDMPLYGFQGKRNEPAQLTRVLATLTELRPESATEIAEITHRNTREILSLPPDYSQGKNTRQNQP